MQTADGGKMQTADWRLFTSIFSPYPYYRKLTGNELKGLFRICNRSADYTLICLNNALVNLFMASR